MQLYPAIDMLDGNAVRLRQVRRDDVTIFAMPCEGTLDMARADKELGRFNKIDSVVYDEAGVTVTADGKEHRFCMTECDQGKCYGCTMPTAPLAATLAGAPTTVEGTPGTPPFRARLYSIPCPNAWPSGAARWNAACAATPAATPAPCA